MSGSPAASAFDARLSALIARAGMRARATGRPVLASATEPLTGTDLLRAFEAVARACAVDDRHGTTLGDARMFWSRGSDDFFLAGLGAVATFRPTGIGRFAEVDGEWTTLLDDALLDDASDDARPLGPVLLGGFAFEPDGPRGGVWRGFPSAYLFVPRLQLSSVGGEQRLTLSTIVAPDGTSDRDEAGLVALHRAVVALLGAPRTTNATADAPADRTGAADDDSLATRAPLADAEWRALVSTAVSEIRAGALDKVVLAREVEAEAPREEDPFVVLHELRAAHRDCFVFGLWRGDRVFIGASPERLARLDGRAVRASSLAGSVKRGATAEEDAALAAALLASAKDRAEHAAVRDALRAGLTGLCDDVSAPEVPTVLTLRHVHHLHTAVRATLRAGHTLLEVIARLHPTPAVGGTPREAALRFIRAHERLDRGWYAAPIGWLARESGEFAVALRSAVLAGRRATLFAGCGIVADSDPAMELAESRLKLRPMLAALSAALEDSTPDPADPVVGAGAIS